MVARGIFKENTKSRPTPGMGQVPGSREADAADRRRTRRRGPDALNTYLKPYLRA